MLEYPSPSSAIVPLLPCVLQTGPRLARGYRNRPEQTAAAYVPNPWFEASTAALNSTSSSSSSDGSAAAAASLREHYRLAYRTSDLVVMGEDGQVKPHAVTPLLKPAA
jgi:non-ribosomal peptide synthetase component F